MDTRSSGVSRPPANLGSRHDGNDDAGTGIPPELYDEIMAMKSQGTGSRTGRSAQSIECGF